MAAGARWFVGAPPSDDSILYHADECATVFLFANFTRQARALKTLPPPNLPIIQYDDQPSTTDRVNKNTFEHPRRALFRQASKTSTALERRDCGLPVEGVAIDGQ
ncbi:hypothetical protein WME90_44875 [Sorangium sp. So ce375]|uniref:hypothetical protein n=1 Tax=Sorangium sp. So ce375 TaxID=3133306 RepID=UPI003F5B3A98